MRTEEHASDDQLMALLVADEESCVFKDTSDHVENCPACQRRLDELAGDNSTKNETRELLGNYQWEELSSCRRLSSVGLEAVTAQCLKCLETPSHPEMLGRLGRYEIERVVGAGGMGVVLKGFDTELNRPVAVKMLAQHLSGVGAARERFARESRAAAAIIHENVVSIHNVEADRETPYLVMQFIAGESLQDRVDRTGPLNVRQVLRIAVQVAAGLTAAHEQGVIHRDIKPSNILLESGVERVLITDFGLARTVDDASLTRTGIIAGTPAYMSPEQANGDAVDQKSDLFSLGSLIYFMATGHPPFRADRAMGVLNRICTHRHKPLWQVAEQIPDELSVLVDQLLEKRPAKRSLSADHVHGRLTTLLANLQQPRNSILRRFKRCVYRYPMRIASLVVVFSLALAAFLGAMLISTVPGEDSSRQAAQQQVASQAEVMVEQSSGPSVRDAIDSSESLQFAEGIEEMRNQLDALTKSPTLSPSGTTMPLKSNDLQLLFQRLERLQQSHIDESHSSEEEK
jgi:serine/threonine protein kinase